MASVAESSADTSASSSKDSDKFRFCIDRGGTFTDIYCEIPKKFRVGKYEGRSSIVLKLLSEDPKNYPDAPREGIRQILSQVTGLELPKHEKVPSELISEVRMGTTVATNALLERNGERCALVTTQGFRDVLEIGNQSRPRIFDLKIDRPRPLYSQSHELDERLRISKWMMMKETEKSNVILTDSGEEIFIEKRPNKEDIKAMLKQISDGGIRSIAVCLMHSHLYSKHEQMVRECALSDEFRDQFDNISLSSDLMPCERIVQRGQTTTADAYLTPCISAYISQFIRGFDDSFIKNVRVLFMQSDGGLCRARSFHGFKAVLSGPAGGVVGCARTTRAHFGPMMSIIGFDMGGTSTDSCRIGAEQSSQSFSSSAEDEFDLVFENVTAGVSIAAPQLDISTVAAGGGSRLFFQMGRFVCGPQSSGSFPGPVCYRHGGYLSITDANLVLGRIVPDYFPQIFGPDANEPLSKELSLKAMQQLTDEINEYSSSISISMKKKSVFDVAYGFIRVANETMCRPIRNLTQGRGYDLKKNHVLATFGGAGGQHACKLARTLGIREVFIHKHAGILSAFGMGLADIVCEKQEPLKCTLDAKGLTLMEIEKRVTLLCTKTLNEMLSDDLSVDTIVLKPSIHLRFDGTDTGVFIAFPSSLAECNVCEITISDESTPKVKCNLPCVEDGQLSDALKYLFEERYQKDYGFVLEREIMVDYIRCRGLSKAKALSESVIEKRPSDEELKPIIDDWPAYFEILSDEKEDEDKDSDSEQGLQLISTPVFDFKQLYFGDEILGPALILCQTSTIVVEQHCLASVTLSGDLKITILKNVPRPITAELEPIQLSIFGHRFMSIAEQMGRVLQRTAVSTNIKERLDFSCAIFGSDGSLVANAPHLPVHLGSMQEAVRYQVRRLEEKGERVERGDVMVSNHPIAGGTHLPDITVMTPVFSSEAEDECLPVFWVASRGHHSDIGGVTPGSMPPFSTHLSEEGAAIESLKLCSKGKMNEDEIIRILCTPSGTHEKCVGTRNLNNNLSDLRAQIAANQRGISLMESLIEEYSLEVVQAYMHHIQDNAAESVKTMLRKVVNDSGKHCLTALDFMDDGSPIQVKVDIDEDEGTAVFDFHGTGPMVLGNCNAPKSVTCSAVIYCLRCMVDLEIPLNQGCLTPITILIPEHSILDPDPDCAVVGGNVLTSQRVTDVIFRAFEACAASQGCMNNLTFGDDEFGYYETIAGGSGAGPSWNGTSAVHTHMTNTRITDPEILESRYPCKLHCFAIRKQSGGIGEYRGGDGALRFIEFCRPLCVSLLCERRSYSPFGLKGGSPAQCGLNLMRRSKDGSIVNLGAKCSLQCEAGDLLMIHTPGGGGFGPPSPAVLSDQSLFSE